MVSLSDLKDSKTFTGFFFVWASAIAIIGLTGAPSFHGKYEIAVVSPYEKAGEVNDNKKPKKFIDTITFIRHNRIAVIRDLKALEFEGVAKMKVPLWTHSLDEQVPMDQGSIVMNETLVAKIFSGELDSNKQRKREREFAEKLNVGEGRFPTIEINSLKPDVYSEFDWFRNRWASWRLNTDKTECISRGKKPNTKLDGTKEDPIDYHDDKPLAHTDNDPFCKNLRFVPKCQCPSTGDSKDFITQWTKWTKKEGKTSEKRSPFTGGPVTIFADQYYHLSLTLIYSAIVCSCLLLDGDHGLTSTLVLLLLVLFAVTLTGSFHFNQYSNLKTGTGPFLLASNEMSSGKTVETDMRMIYGTGAVMSMVAFVMQLMFIPVFLIYMKVHDGFVTGNSKYINFITNLCSCSCWESVEGTKAASGFF